MRIRSVILIVGVNGSGKTTTIAKLGKRFCDEGKSVLFGAADTFRAAAVDQLQVWGDRLKVEVVAGAPESDPGAVAFNAVQSGIAHKVDLILIDTAGRLHTRFNLMEELKKIYRVVGKALNGAPHAVWLVLDATTGQNALQQARAFKDAVNCNRRNLNETGFIGARRNGFCYSTRIGFADFVCGLGREAGRFGTVQSGSICKWNFRFIILEELMQDLLDRLTRAQELTTQLLDRL